MRIALGDVHVTVAGKVGKPKGPGAGPSASGTCARACRAQIAQPSVLPKWISGLPSTTFPAQRRSIPWVANVSEKGWNAG